MDLEALEQFVLAEIASYQYEVSEEALGRPFSDDKVERLLVEMRAALVKPEWHMVDTSNTHAVARGLAEPQRCALVADDGDFQLYYEPVEGLFTLAMGDPPATIGVDGDAVGCWFAR